MKKKQKQKRLSLIEKIAIMIAAALPITTFVIILWDSQEVGSDVEI